MKGFALRLTINNCQADWLTDVIRDCLIDLFSDQLIDWFFDFLGVWLIAWCYEWMTDWLIEWLTDSVIDWLTDWLMIGHQWTKQELGNRLTYKWTNWLIEWLTDWLIDWLIDLQASWEVSSYNSFEVYLSHDFVTNLLLFPFQENLLWR